MRKANWNLLALMCISGFVSSVFSAMAVLSGWQLGMALIWGVIGGFCMGVAAVFAASAMAGGGEG